MSPEPRLLPGYAIIEIKPPESPIERLMLDLLEGGLDLGVRAQFCAVNTWSEAKATLRDHPEAFSRARLVVFPQVAVGGYRMDFLVAATDRVMTTLDAFNDFDLLAVECDGSEFHGPQAGGLRDDRTREAAIRKQTGLDFLRFSGAELNFRSEQVVEVLSAYIEARFAHRKIARARLDHLERVHGYARSEVQDMAPEMPEPIGRVIATARDLSGMPALRYEYQSAASEKKVAAFRAALAAMRQWMEDWQPVCPICDEI
ncbi:hypothetical protein F1643_21595 [Azospirillum sp. INR13]|uniref:endonuclease domain-containing protein n=1 Tax=Azospirillum sp. INR13 TaxID=2596919 RepID=UPI00189232DC|nr:hypothetical protein [Azospirillum sp. INR13]MBF5096586.1 hypothetical protein [Azospirillum sp. INR13]